MKFLVSYTELVSYETTEIEAEGKDEAQVKFIEKLNRAEIEPNERDCQRIDIEKQGNSHNLKKGIIGVKLQYEIPEGQDVQEYLENVELPKEYVEDSFEIVKIEE